MSWPELPLSEVLESRQERPTDDDMVSGRLRIVSKIAFADGSILFRSDHETKTPMIIVQPGDLLVSGINAYKGAIALYPVDAPGPAAAMIHYSAYGIRRDRAEPAYLWRLLRSDVFRERLERAVPGGIKTELKASRLLPVSVPLPPLDEQRRIAGRLSAVLDKLDRAQELRQQATAETNALLGSCAQKLLEDVSTPPRQRLSVLAEVRGGIQKSPERLPAANPVRYLTVAHVQRNRILTDDPRFFEVSSEELSQWRLQRGDVLIIEGNGSASQIGRTALYRGEVDVCVHQNHVIRARPDPTKLDPEYLNFYLNSPAGQDEVQSRSRTTSGLRILSVGRIKEIEIPLPGLDIQQDLVNKYSNLESQVLGLKDSQKATAGSMASLQKAMMQRAFEGFL